MRAALWASLLTVLIVFAVDLQAGCSVCIPNCQAAIETVTGRVNCASTASYCKIWGDYCAGGSECECGTAGCNPCNATCAPAPVPQWELVRVDVRTTPRPMPEAQWTLVVMPAKKDHS